MRPTEAQTSPARPGRGGPAAGSEEPGPEEKGPVASGLITLTGWARALERAVAFVPAALLAAMMGLTFANVLLRYVFRQPISGAFELLSYMMGVLVFLSLVLVTARAEHVRISVLDPFLPRWLRRLRTVLFNLVMAAASAGLAWRFWLHAQRPRVAAERTQMYELPIGRLIEFMAVCTAACAVLFLLTALVVAMRRGFLADAET